MIEIQKNPPIEISVFAWYAYYYATINNKEGASILVELPAKEFEN